MSSVLIFYIDKYVAWCVFIGLENVVYLVDYFVLVGYTKPSDMLVSALDNRRSHMFSWLFRYDVQFRLGVYLIKIYVLVVVDKIGVSDMPKAFHKWLESL